MRTIYDIRYENIRKEMQLEGIDTVTELASRYGKSQGYMNNLLGNHPNKKIGEKVARSFEIFFNLPQGYLDKDHTLEGFEPVHIPGKDEIGNRIKQKIIESHETVASIASASLLELDRVKSIIQGPNHSTSQGELSKIANVLGVSLNWVLTGNDTPTTENISNVSPAPKIRHHEIPVLGKVSAGNFKHTQELEPHEVEEWVGALKNYHGRAFGLRVDGDSMTSPTGKSYPADSVAVFDSGNKSPKNGDLVLAKPVDADEVTFKKYVNDAGKQYLMPLNPQYPRIDPPFEVVAVFEYAVIF